MCGDLSECVTACVCFAECCECVCACVDGCPECDMDGARAEAGLMVCVAICVSV